MITHFAVRYEPGERFVLEQREWNELQKVATELSVEPNSKKAIEAVEPEQTHAGSFDSFLQKTEQWAKDH